MFYYDSNMSENIKRPGSPIVHEEEEAEDDEDYLILSQVEVAKASVPTSVTSSGKRGAQDGRKGSKRRAKRRKKWVGPGTLFFMLLNCFRLNETIVTSLKFSSVF